MAASAPGKIVLLGEYAVLDGAPALVMAANRRAEVLLESGSQATYTVHAPDISSRDASFTLTQDGTLRWQNVSEAVRENFRLVAQILRSLVRQGLITFTQSPAFTATLVTMEFFRRGAAGSRDKLGLGSSAALTVAFASALAEYTGQPVQRLDPNAWLVSLLTAHRRFQNGRGSGLDIAASLYGGVIGYCVGETDQQPRVEQLTLPPELRLLFVWSGKSASTQRFLENVAAREASNPSGMRSLLNDLGAVSSEGIAALKNGHCERFIESVAAYGGALRRFGETCRIDIYSAEHQQIAKLSEKASVAYKPCGAGGGDMGVAFSTDPEALGYLKAQLDEIGFEALGLKVDQTGVVTRITE